MTEIPKELLKKAPVVQSVAEMDAELKALELQAAKLSILEKEANLQDVRERLAEREMKRDNLRMKSYTNGQTLKQLAAADAAAQKRCNHRKGGQGMGAIVGGQGDDSQMSVIKHQFCNGDTWVRCQRCGKTWKPALREMFETEVGYLGAVAEYQAAVNFQTRNITSSSYMFRFSDGGQYYREVTSNSNLR
jgi:hypothetical protein